MKTITNRLTLFVVIFNHLIVLNINIMKTIVNRLTLPLTMHSRISYCDSIQFIIS